MLDISLGKKRYNLYFELMWNNAHLAPFPSSSPDAGETTREEKILNLYLKDNTFLEDRSSPIKYLTHSFARGLHKSGKEGESDSK